VNRTVIKIVIKIQLQLLSVLTLPANDVSLA
jgi:hypothetical protein